MKDMHPEYKAVIGLEIHAQLLSKSKMFATEVAAYGGEPNSYVSPISLGHPGTLPAVNGKCIEFAIKMGLATGCEITRRTEFSRKNYFYADLPKGYQITQYDKPICTAGRINITLKDGSKRSIRIHRIHIEEDSGKSMHDQDVHHSLIDLNRAGIGLIEIVSEADMSTAEEAAAYVTEFRKLVRYLEICDGNMEEGSLRCDANVSVMKKDATEWGTKVEVKNMNSTSNIARAINYEITRQIEEIEKGGTIRLETRGWDAVNGRTVMQRENQTLDDYRYFPEPDLLPLHVTDEMLDKVRAELPELPEALYERYTKELGLSMDDALTILEQKEFAQYYNAVLETGADVKTTTSWMLGPVKNYLNEQARHIDEYATHVSPAATATAVGLIASGETSFSLAKDKLHPLMLDSAPDADPKALAEAHDLLLEKTDSTEIEQIMAELMAQNPDKVEAFRSGKNGLLGFFMGQVMRATGGKYDPAEVNRIVRELLEG